MDENNTEILANDENSSDPNREQMEFGTQGFEKIQPPRVENDPKRIALKRSIEESFNALVPGMKISVTRLKPKWCSGWIDTFDVEFDENDNPVIDLAEIREAYGGEKLMLRFLDSNGRYIWANTVDFRGVQPRDNGQELENPKIKEARELAEMKRRESQAVEQKSNDSLIRMLLEMQEKNHANMIASLQRQQTTDSKPFGQIDELLAALDKLEGFRGNPQAPAGNAADISGMLTGLVSMLGQQQQTAPEPQKPSMRPAGPPPGARPQPRMPMAGVPQNVVPFTPQNPQPAAAPMQSPSPEQPKQESKPMQQQEQETEQSENENDNDAPDIVDELASMDNEELAETVAELLGTIGEERTAEIFQHFDRLSKAQ